MARTSNLGELSSLVSTATVGLTGTVKNVLSAVNHCAAGLDALADNMEDAATKSRDFDKMEREYDFRRRHAELKKLLAAEEAEK